MYSEDMKEFMVKVVGRSGLGQQSTYLPQAINPMFGEEPKNDMATAMLEAKTVMCGAVEDLLNKTGELFSSSPQQGWGETTKEKRQLHVAVGVAAAGPTKMQHSATFCSHHVLPTKSLCQSVCRAACL